MFRGLVPFLGLKRIGTVTSQAGYRAASITSPAACRLTHAVQGGSDSRGSRRHWDFHVRGPRPCQWQCPPLRQQDSDSDRRRMPRARSLPPARAGPWARPGPPRAGAAFKLRQRPPRASVPTTRRDVGGAAWSPRHDSEPRQNGPRLGRAPLGAARRLGRAAIGRLAATCQCPSDSVTWPPTWPAAPARQVRYFTRPKSETMITRQLGLPPRYRRV